MTMEQTINRNLLKHMVGQQMFCPQCKKVLDWKRSVQVDMVDRKGEVVQSLVPHCTDCWETVWKQKFADLKGRMDKIGMTLAVLDGRKLWAK